MSQLSVASDDNVVPLLLSVEQAARRLGVGRTTMFGLVGTGEVRSVMIGRLRRVPVQALTEYVHALSNQAADDSAAVS